MEDSEAAVADNEALDRETLQRYSISKYLGFAETDIYMKDAIRQLLNAKEDNPLPFLMGYFERLLWYTHMAGREFEFVTATQRNRRALVLLCQNTYSNIDKEEVMTVDDWHYLLTKLCPDFPREFVRRCAQPLLLLHPVSQQTTDGTANGNGGGGGTDPTAALGGGEDVERLCFGQMKRSLFVGLYYERYLLEVALPAFRDVADKRVGSGTPPANALGRNKTSDQHRNDFLDNMLQNYCVSALALLTILRVRHIQHASLEFRIVPFEAVQHAVEASGHRDLSFLQFQALLMTSDQVVQPLLHRPKIKSKGQKIEAALLAVGLEVPDVTEDSDSGIHETRNKKTSKKKR
mmetsp:Transcript_21917/g.31825  ORF Transcript_21917/g.31825 Transcript_21917/m.31825 type:complete len:348 (-) Transcript_21917:186-1229(-)|eukprot:CAMPEP_0113935954 /NCGR_PEP_ID=MMETSP1339-20121228/2970_1 /TAXON_ID=94617 /ORGANISM="Fibrocapsa japonica" /LENGTH=347 /DNA_ID=CAMNT_0000938261 /DNA_START=36 /DNA_END=1079 /DNA_ORIENTATION=+ /assembly_acc=CAM_ASM_000762